MTLLILGGTGEAVRLAGLVAAAVPGLEVVTSLAGHTPAHGPGVRVGGFGGAAGLAAYLRAHDIAAVIDATHPFAVRISAHARAACAATGVPLASLSRPPWPRQAEDRWIEVESLPEAAARLPDLGRRAFLTVGLHGVPAFAAMPEVWFLVRLLALATVPLADCTVIAGRGPFTETDEAALMRVHAIDVVVTKASGGAATYAKIAAARALGLPVLMVRRPPAAEAGLSPEAAATWLGEVFSRR
ncbi:MAG: cobalt-precorrin-6A reductase [Magnetospirillum sp.]|nr:cobalt-precorrin-6A reductase [Magnetospirillum sp.]